MALFRLPVNVWSCVSYGKKSLKASFYGLTSTSVTIARGIFRYHVEKLQDAYFINDPAQRKYVTPTEFKKRFKKYCELKGYVFNPQMYDPSTGQPYKFDRDGKPITDIKSGGIEYFCIGDAAFNVHSVNTSSLPFDTAEGKLEF